MRPVDPRRSRIVLVGTPFYDDDRLHDVPQVSNNIADLFNLFTDPDRGGFDAAECKVAPPDAGIDQIGALLLAATSEADDLLLFYFSGHGVIGRRHRGLHLGVKRTDRENVDFSGLDYERVRDACLSARAANRIVILDCCYSGQATNGTLGALADEVLADIAIDGTVVLASAPANRAALVVDGEQHTAYTGRMLEVLRKGIPGKGEFLSAIDIHEALYRVMRSQGLPEPQQRSTGMIHELGVVRNGSFGEDSEPATFTSPGAVALPGAVPLPGTLAVPGGAGPETPPTVSVLLSYAETDRGTAEEIGAALRRQGVDARLYNTFLLDDPTIVNSGLARVVVPLVTTAYLDREETEGDLSAALVNPGTSLLPVIAGADPAPATQRGARIWERLELRRYLRLTPADPHHEALVAAIRSAAARAAAGGPAARIVPLPDEVTIWYDWEDGNLVDGAVASLTDAGTVVLSATSAIPQPPRSSAGNGYDVAVLWTPAAQSNVAIQRALFHARDALYLVGPQSPVVPGGGRAVRVQTEAPRPRRPASIGDPGEDVRRRLADAVARNGGVPFHLVGDKFCRDRATAGVVATAYAVAVARLDRTHPDRRAAVLAHAAVLRFQGRWPEALGILRFECGRGSHPELFDLALDLDLLSLTFESGEVASIPRQTNELLRRALDEEDWPAVIAAYRLLGMYGEETGDFRHARDHLSRAYHYAEGLMDSAPLRRRVASRTARLALAVDCLRDMAGLEWRDGDLAAARAHLGEARELLEGIAAEPVGVYLGHVIDYQQARIGYADTHDYEAAKKLLNRSYQGLTTFGNPIRLALLLESVVRLEMDFLRHRDDDARLLIPTLQKVRRVYTSRGHAYLAARAEAALGDLEFALGHWERADDIYEEAAAELHRLEKTPDYVNAEIARSRCAVRRGNNALAVELLEELIGQLDGPDQRKRRADIRSELSRLRPEPLDETRLATDVEMTGVGEFTIHSWISDLLGSGLADRDLFDADADTGVVLGMGDDAAILRAGDGADFVVSTDSVPPDLLHEDTPAGAKYVARLAVVSALSDVLAMGGRPTAVLVNLHLPRSKPVVWSTEFFKAAKIEAARYGATIVGGDLKEQPREGLTVVAVGLVERGRALTRNGASPGDLLVVTLSGGSGQLGARWAHDLWIHLSEREQALLADIVHDDARYRSLQLPVEIMEAVTAAQLPTSAMDTTDGILACAQLMGRASNVGFEMFPQAIEPHLHPTIRHLADSLGIAPFLFALNAGHDWEVVFTVAREDEARLDELIHRNGVDGRPELAVIGQVLPREPWADLGIHIPEPDVLLPYFTDEKFTPMPARHRAREWLDYARDSSRHFPKATGNGQQ